MKYVSRLAVLLVVAETVAEIVAGRGRDDDGMGRRPRDPWEEGYA